MTLDIFFKLLVLVAVVGAGWYAGRTPLMAGPEPVKAISTLAFYLLIPALLFRSMATADLAHLPWATLVAFFVPTTACRARAMSTSASTVASVSRVRACRLMMAT